MAAEKMQRSTRRGRGPVWLAMMALLAWPLGAQAAIGFVQTTHGTATGTGVSASYLAPPTAGNLLVAIAANRDASTAPTAPTGWTEAIVNTISPGQIVYYRIAGAGEPSLVTVGPYGSSGPLTLQISEWSGVNPVSPLHTNGQANGTGTTISSGTAMTSVDEALLIVGVVTKTPENVHDWTNGFSELRNVEYSSTTVASAYRLVLGAGAYDAQVTTNGSAAWRGQIVAFRAAAPAGVVTVDTTSDVADAPGYGTPALTIAALLGDPGPDTFISLREAIDACNNTPNGAGPDSIHFDIPASDPGYSASPLAYALTPSIPLPELSTPMVIDASSQPEAAGEGRPVIVLDGTGVSSGEENGFLVTGGATTLRGFVIQEFDKYGIHLQGAGGNRIVGNYIGTDATGGSAAPNLYGLFVETGSNTIGGTGGGEGNVISGNTQYGLSLYTAGATGNLIQGNTIGLDATGVAVLPNGLTGLEIYGGAHGNIIGGSAAGLGNVISGNGINGIWIMSGGMDHVIEGNLIGTNAAGDAALSNGDHGVRITAAADCRIGGPVAGAGNLISGNAQMGIYVDGAAATGIVIEGNLIGTSANGTGPCPTAGASAWPAAPRSEATEPPAAT